MPGGDVTHPIPDNTGYITEGQYYLHGNRIDPFGSLSRLKQQLIGKVTREDHGDVANAQIRLYAESKKAKERESMVCRPSKWDQKLLKFTELFEKRMMNLEVNIPIEEALDLGCRLFLNALRKTKLELKNPLQINTGQKVKCGRNKDNKK